ncbi:MAG TPA: hypothetical protein VJB57_02870 [Dehalococcoidia bacterium]|nr:hypothetical protein [Dehalococcoidia bacterium]
MVKARLRSDNVLVSAALSATVDEPVPSQFEEDVRDPSLRQSQLIGDFADPGGGIRGDIEEDSTAAAHQCVFGRVEPGPDALIAAL